MRLLQNWAGRGALATAMAAVAFLAACTEAVSPDRALSVATDRERYDRAPERLASVSVTVRNVSDETLYLGRCGSTLAMYVDRHEGGEWIEFLRLGVVCQAAYEMSPIVLEPAESLTPAALSLGPGIYRLRVPFGLSTDTQHDRTAMSHPFVVGG